MRSAAASRRRIAQSALIAALVLDLEQECDEEQSVDALDEGMSDIAPRLVEWQKSHEALTVERQQDELDDRICAAETLQDLLADR